MTKRRVSPSEKRKLCPHRAAVIYAAYHAERIAAGLLAGERPDRDERVPTQASLARDFGISSQIVHHIVTGNLYRDATIDRPDYPSWVTQPREEILSYRYPTQRTPCIHDGLPGQPIVAPPTRVVDLPIAVRAQIVERWKAGVPPRRLASQFGVTLNSVHRYVQERQRMKTGRACAVGLECASCWLPDCYVVIGIAEARQIIAATQLGLALEQTGESLDAYADRNHLDRRMALRYLALYHAAREIQDRSDAR